MKNLIVKNQNTQLIYNCYIISFLIFSFPFSILIKDFIKILNLNEIIFLKEYLEFINQYILVFIRSIICGIFCFIILLYKTKFNKNVFLLLILNFIFFFNLFFSDPLLFKEDFHTFFEKLKPYKSYQIDQNNFFLNNIKIILISMFNIIIPLFALSFKEFQLKDVSFLESFNYLYKYFLIFLFLIILILLFQLIYFRNQDDFELKNFFYWNIFLKSYFINYHITLIPVSLFIITKIYKKIVTNKNFEKLEILLLFISFLIIIILKANLQIACIFLSSVVIFSYTYLNSKTKLFKFNERFIFLAFLLFILLFLIILLKIFDFNEYGLKSSIIYRKLIYNFYFENINNINVFGNSLIKSKIWVAPHNLFFDILYFSGVLGFILFIFFIKKIFKKFSLIFIISFYFLSISLFSGFFFLNPVLMIFLAMSLHVFKEKL